MRFLSKKCIIGFVIIVAISAIVFLCCHDVSGFHSYNICPLNVLGEQREIDNTIFNLHYENKVWTFKASQFELSSDLFNINERINRYKRNGSRQDKIELINKLIEINIEPEIAFNYIYFGFNNKLNNIKRNIEKCPKNAEIKIGNKINISNEIVGIKLDTYLFYNNLINLYKNNKIININIPVIKSIPNITSQDLLKYTHKRSEFSTSIETSSTGRKFNVRKALNAIHGKHLLNREKFSFNDCVGPRTIERGYKNAKVILDGEFVEGVGGGVCQVSSTLYNAALLAGLNVTHSQKHSQRVGYVKGGFDAMVNYGTSDLVFENNTGGDLYILCKYTNSQITISIYGAPLGEVSYTRYSEIVNQVAPEDSEIIYDEQGKYIDKVVYNDEFFELKKPKDGYTIKSYIIKYISGMESDKKLLRTDKYKPQRGVIIYGTRERGTDVNILDMITNVVE